MKIKEFIEKAVEGGWSMDDYHPMYITTAEPKHVPLEGIFLDPLAWQAVGRVEGWEKRHNYACYIHLDGGKCDCVPEEEWEARMHDMIDALCEGTSIEEFISNL